MTASFEIVYSPVDDALSFCGRVPMSDLANLRLDHIDRALLSAPAATSADMLQSLEVVFRRLEQQRETMPEPSA